MLHVRSSLVGLPFGTIGDEPTTRYTRAKVLTERGRTPIFIRFSTVVGGRNAPETARDPRGFAIKFYTKDGNWDLVGNNLPIFFIRDALKFPDMVHAFKPDPVTNAEEAWRFYDFVANSPETLHMVTWVKSPWGIPANYREMIGSGVNTYRWLNDRGEAFLVKYHWVFKGGNSNLTSAQAAEIQGKDVGHATKDLYEAIERGDYPEWEMRVQLMPEGEHPELSFDPLDDTKVWPEDQFPKRPVGRMVLDRNPQNVFAKTEQASFGTGVLVDGMDFSDDKMLIGRTFSYSDTQRYRVGPNYLQLAINKPKVPTHTNQRDGQVAAFVDDSGSNPHVNYEPSTDGGLTEAPHPKRDWYQHVDAHVMRHGILRTADDHTQAGERYRSFEDWEREDLLTNVGNDLKQRPQEIALRMVWHLYHCDENYGTEVAKRAGIDLKNAPALDPLPNRPGPGANRTLTMRNEHEAASGDDGNTSGNGATGNGAKKTPPVGASAT